MLRIDWRRKLTRWSEGIVKETITKVTHVKNKKDNNFIKYYSTMSYSTEVKEVNICNGTKRTGAAGLFVNYTHFP